MDLLHRRHYRPRQRQRGVATLLLVLMVGLAMTATALGVMHFMHGTQENELAVHSLTSSQNEAWRGAELLRRYLQVIDESTLAGLSGKVTIDDGGHVSASIVSVRKLSSTGHAYRVVANLHGTAAESTRAASSSVLQVVYAVTPADSGGGSGGTGGTSQISTFNIYKDLKLNGGIHIKGGKSANLNVQGNVTTGGIDLEGVNAIRATGNVSIGSSAHVHLIYANGNVKLTGAASADQVRALGNVVFNSGKNAKPTLLIQANGTVTVSNSGTISAIQAIGDMLVPGSAGAIGTIESMADVKWTSTGGSASNIHANGNVTYDSNGIMPPTDIAALGNVTLHGPGVQSVLTKGNTTLNAGYGRIGSIKGEGNLYVNSWGGTDGNKLTAKGTIGGRLSKANPGMLTDVNVVPGYTVDVATVSLTPLAALTMQQPQVDAYALKSSANYVFDFTGGAIRVTVSGVNGITDGTYYLGDYNLSGQSYRDYLCSKLKPGSLGSNGKGQCMSPATPAHTICQGYSKENGCLSYNSGQWSLGGNSFARGTLWFHGDLNVGVGDYLDTFIATGNITTAGSTRVDSPNYAGFAAMCTNATPDGFLGNVGSNALQQFTKDGEKAFLDGSYAKNLCDMGNAKLIPSALGNVAFLAGGYVNGGYVGGDISIGAKSVINGSVLAGNTLSTGGNTNINGHILSAALNKNDQTPSSFGGMTVMDLSQLPSSYDPGKVPCTGNCKNGSSGGGKSQSRIVWTRYL